jgi:hypothetical protein
MGLSKLLTYQGRLTLINMVLSALPAYYMCATYYMCTLKIPINLFEQIDKYKKHNL